MTFKRGTSTVGKCYMCGEVKETSVRNTQRNGTKLLICRECRNEQHKEWKMRESISSFNQTIDELISLGGGRVRS